MGNNESGYVTSGKNERKALSSKSQLVRKKGRSQGQNLCNKVDFPLFALLYILYDIMVYYILPCLT